jgi:O-antigen/teichoic acid export membrane protein
MDGRDETELERWDRNFNELLQELRVAQTGVQILFAFLLTVAFSNRFADVSALEKWVFVVTLLAAATATALLIAPVSYHRLVFRQGRKPELVHVATTLAKMGLLFLGLAIVGTVFLALDKVVGGIVAATGTVTVALLYTALWYALPVVNGRRRRPAPQPPTQGT